MAIIDERYLPAIKGSLIIFGLKRPPSSAKKSPEAPKPKSSDKPEAQPEPKQEPPSTSDKTV